MAAFTHQKDALASGPDGVPAASGEPAIDILTRSVARARRRRIIVTLVLVALVLAFAAIEMLGGNTWYTPDVIFRVLSGHTVKGASFAVWNVRLPRLIAGLIAGFSFGLAGNIFQTMLRNPLASPDVIGITSGSSAVAVFCILVLHVSGQSSSMWAMLGGLLVAGAIFGLASWGGFTIAKCILVGLGVQALARAGISFMLLKAAEYDVSSALRWMSGSLSGIGMDDTVPLLATLPFIVVVLAASRHLRVLELGNEAATGLGARPGAIRAVLVVSTVMLIALGSSVTGPIACVTLLAGPIASRLVKQGPSAPLQSGLVGVALVLAADLCGLHLMGTRFPVGVVTGILGAPYLIWLLVGLNKGGKH